MNKVLSKINSLIDPLKACAFLVLFLLALTGEVVQAAMPPGQTTVPYQMTYTARLRTAAGLPVTTAHQVRFSLWTDGDYDAADWILGVINVLAPGYAGWQETHTVLPNSEGIYTVQLGSINVLPNFVNSAHLFMQVDVKAQALPDTSFEVLDPDGNLANTSDRKPFNSAPYAINADTVDNRDAGFGPGQLPYLNAGSKLDFSLMPGGVNDNFVLDVDNSTETAGTGKIVLKFGDTLNKVLEYDLDNSYFNFNDDVNIQGNLTVGGAPIGPGNKTLVYEPMYADAVIDQDGSDNRGKLEIKFVDTDGAPGNANFNHYIYTTRQNSLQDLDLVLRVKVPDGFVNWAVANPVELNYQTLDGNLANNKIDLVIEDTAGNPVTLAGASNLANSSWTTGNINFSGTPTFAPGQSMTIKIKLTTSDLGMVKLGKLKFNYFGS